MSQHHPARTRHVSPYPGVRNPYNRHPLQEELTIPETTPAAIDAAQSSSLVPFANPSVTPVTPVASTSKFPFNFNFGDIKGFIDRMGGIDGIVSTVSKVQKVMQSVSQIAPVVKMMADVLLPGKKKDGDDDWSSKKRRRRRRRKRQSTNKSKQRRRPTSSKGSKGYKGYKPKR
ncbi:hypothetical protein [Paenibacillus guangzhouensis]|uniref:hypothetical protein n=1 Tax=Paenibacillus guangzhouensis TaxID=1473112 RepID=UPI00126758CD|nr:hypothetical protein [Paenibacillus guangzhouensis]